MNIDTSTSLEQHATWLATNPVVGCPKRCEYCFLRPDNLNQTVPVELFTPEEAINTLKDSNLYNTEIPVAIGTRTDMFSTPQNVGYYDRFLTLWNENGVPNPLIMITKCFVRDRTIKLLQKAQGSGSNPIFYLSYSGLDNTIEKGIDHNQLRQNFQRLDDSGIPVVHYWRPFVPQNSSLEKMLPVIDLAVKHSKASVIDGLRMTPEMVQQFSFWPELSEAGLDLSNTESIYTEDSQVNLKYLQAEYPEHPMLYASSCAIANIEEIPDYNAVYGTHVCHKSSCPTTQRGRCENFHGNRVINPEEVGRHLARLAVNASFIINQDENGISTLEIDASLSHNILVNLTQALKMRVKANSVIEVGYGWGSHHDRKTIIIK